MPHAVLRALRETDAEEVAALVRTTFAEHVGVVDPPPSAVRENGPAIAALLARGGGVGTEHDGRLVACMLWEEKDGGLYVGRVAVVPEFRGKGLVRHMLAEAEAAARAAGLPRMWLSTRLPLTGNRAVFARCGFVETALHAHAGYAEPTWVDMEKRLA